MANKIFNTFVFFTALFFTVCQSFASTPNLIDTLYNANIDDTSKKDDSEKSGPKLDGEFGLLIATGNTVAQTYITKINAQNETTNWNNQYYLNYLFKESLVDSDDGESSYSDITANRLYFSSQFDYKLNSKSKRVFVYADYEDDDFNGYDMQSSIATGWSQVVFAKENSQFRYSIGPGWTFAKLDSGERDDNTDGIIIRSSVDYRYEWETGARVSGFFSTEIGDENIKSRLEASLSANIIGSLGIKLSWAAVHNTLESSEIIELATESNITVVYSFF